MKGVFNAILYQNRVIMLEIRVLVIFLGSVSASAQIPDPVYHTHFHKHIWLRSTQVSNLSLLLSKYR